MITCSVCGTQNPDGTQYCEGCGVELTSTTAAPENPPAPAPEAAPAEPNPAAPQPAEPQAETAPEALPESIPEAEAPAPQDTTAAETPAAPPAPAEAAFRPARLTLKRFGALTSDVIPLQGPRLVVGRFDASTGPVEIDLTGIQGSENISRRHAELFFEDGAWKVRDLGSTNGVFIKRAGEAAYSPRLVEPAALHSGDELAFGNVIVVFEEG